jgi:hypothetical protein
VAFCLFKKESEWFIVKKQPSYLLAAITVVLLVLCVVLYISGRNNLNELSDVQAMLLDVTNERDSLIAEKKQWEADKLLVGRSISTVKTVLIDALSDLDKVSNTIGAEVLEVEKLLEPKPTAVPAGEEKKSPAASDKPKEPVKTDVAVEDTDKSKEEKAPVDKPKDDKTLTDKHETKGEPAKTDKTEAKDKPSETPKAESKPKTTPESEKPALKPTKKP